MCAMHHIDTMSLGVLSFLQTHQLVTGVEAKEQAGATTLQVSLWEQVWIVTNCLRPRICSVRNSQCLLPRPRTTRSMRRCDCPTT